MEIAASSRKFVSSEEVGGAVEARSNVVATLTGKFVGDIVGEVDCEIE
jgi:hypothetical protein